MRFTGNKRITDDDGGDWEKKKERPPFFMLQEREGDFILSIPPPAVSANRRVDIMSLG